MSRTQRTPSLFDKQPELERRVAALERALALRALADVNTTGLTSAQIDALVFGGTDAQPFDGVQITDKTNRLLVVRESGKWNKVSLTLIP